MMYRPLLFPVRSLASADTIFDTPVAFKSTSHGGCHRTTISSAQELVERYYYKGWNKGDVNVIKEVMTVDVKFRGALGRRPKKGQEAVIEYMQSAHRALARNLVKIDNLVISENWSKVAARVTHRGVHKGNFFGVEGSGHEVSWSAAAFFIISNGVISDVWILGDVDSLKNEIGAEQDASAFSKSSLEA
jgi:steroid delta-isomerase-like uncharacterized protein